MTGVFTGIGPPLSSRTPADLAGTFRECAIDYFFQILFGNFRKKFEGSRDLMTCEMKLESPKILALVPAQLENKDDDN